MSAPTESDEPSSVAIHSIHSTGGLVEWTVDAKGQLYDGMDPRRASVEWMDSGMDTWKLFTAFSR